MDDGRHIDKKEDKPQTKGKKIKKAEKLKTSDEKDKSSKIRNGPAVNKKLDDLLTPPKTGKKGGDKTSKSEASTIKMPAFGLAKNILSKIEQADEEKADSKDEVSTRDVQKQYLPNDVNGTNLILQKFVTFYLDDEEYGLPIWQVQEINRVADITRLPNSPDYVSGVVNLRGKILPVIELKFRLQLGRTELDKHCRIVVVDYENKHMGLLVDKVSKVLSLEDEKIERAPEEIVKVEENFARGVAMDGESMIIILDIDKILTKAT